MSVLVRFFCGSLFAIAILLAGGCHGTVTVPAPIEDEGPGCNDGLQNGDESGVDCGGSCKPCAVGSCAPASCDDDVRNGSETGVDCGGPLCEPCAVDVGCALPSDCDSGVCDPLSGLCAAPSCDDGVKNGTETDRDCGGTACSPCFIGASCGNAVAADDDSSCASGGAKGVCAGIPRATTAQKQATKPTLTAAAHSVALAPMAVCAACMQTAPVGLAMA